MDWSGAKQPKAKLWLARAEEGALASLEEFASREALVAYVIAYCTRHPATVAGFDFSFSLPSWYLGQLGLRSAPELWGHLAEEGEGYLRDCAPPYWGRRGKSQPDHDSFRVTERQVQAVGGIRPKSTFQIAGAGSVGTGSLRGMPFLHEMQRAGIAIWPFDPPRLPMVVEVYPRLLTGPVVKSSRQARTAYLEAQWPSLSREHRVLAASSEDAFDAAVSALEMARHPGAFMREPTIPAAALEGEIWQPPQPPETSSLRAVGGMKNSR